MSHPTRESIIKDLQAELAVKDAEIAELKAVITGNGLHLPSCPVKPPLYRGICSCRVAPKDDQTSTARQEWLERLHEPDAPPAALKETK